MNSTIFDQAQRHWEEEPTEEDEVCEDCGQRKCVCAQLDEI